MTDTTTTLASSIVPGHGKVSVVLAVQHRTARFGGRNHWFRWADPALLDPEDRTAANLADQALTHPDDRDLAQWFQMAREIPADAAQAYVQVNGRPLYDEPLCEMWDTVCSGVDDPPAWDWPVTT